MTPLPLVLTLVAVVTAYNNTTAEYKLQTRLRLADYTKLAYDGLYLQVVFPPANALRSSLATALLTTPAPA